MSQKLTDSSKTSSLSSELLVKIHDLMVKSRVLEERLIKIYKTGEAYFWIGAPGEEAFGVALGLLANKGQGVEYDYFHLHYRGTPTLVAMGLTMEDSIRLIMNKETDPCTGGRNFSNHYCFPEWNVVPVTSPIEVQYTVAIGTALAQKNNPKLGITVVTGGDAGSAEGDFASSLIWASRPGNELPMLLTVQNNRVGISTAYEDQHGEEYIADRGKAFRMKTMVINGLDPVESYLKLKEAYEYVRIERKPLLLEARVSRLYGHSSASGANFEDSFSDPLQTFEKTLMKHSILSEAEIKNIYKKYEDESWEAVEKVRSEKPPRAETVWDHTYAQGENADWRKF